MKKWERFKNFMIDFFGEVEDDKTLTIENISKTEQIEVLKFLENLRNKDKKDNYELIFK